MDNDLEEHRAIDEVELTPIALKKPFIRRFIVSDEEVSEEEEDLRPNKLLKLKRVKPKLTKPKDKPVKRKPVKPKPVKSKPVKSKPIKPKHVKPKPVKSKLVKPKPTKPVSRSPSPVSRSPSPLKPIAKPTRKIWGAKDKRDLEVAFFAFNPCNDKDWEQVVQALPVEWSVGEVKQQAKKMKLKPLALMDKNKTPKLTAISKIRQLIPDGKLPNKGTIRREALEEEVMQQLFVKRNKNETVLGTNLNESYDSDDLLIREAMQSHALESVHANETNNKFVTPSKRTFFPKAISACRRRTSIGGINSVDDDFTIPDRGKMKYRLKFRAQQFGRQRGANAARNRKKVEFQDDSDSIVEDDEF